MTRYHRELANPNLPMEEVLSYLTRGLAAAATVAGVFWKGDNLLSDRGRKSIYASLLTSWQIAEKDPSLFASKFFLSFFDLHGSALRFISNTIIFTAASMIILFLLYASTISGFMTQIVTDSYARGPLLSQLLSEGIFVVLVTNYISFSVMSWTLSKRRGISTFLALSIDIVVKLIIFYLATLALYCYFVRFIGSFNGNYRSAIFAVGPTLAGASLFRNLTSVYLYSVALSSLPLYIMATRDLLATNKRLAAIVVGFFFFLPFEDKPIRALAVVFGIFIAVFGFVAMAFARLLS